MLWAKSAWGPWGPGHTFGDKLHVTRDIPEDKWIPTKLQAPTVAEPAPKPAPTHGKQPAAKPAAASWSIPVADGQHVQLFKTLWTLRGSFTLSLFSSRGMQQTDGLMHCIENFAYLHHEHGTISMYACQRVSQSLGQATDWPSILHSMCW